MSSRVPPELVSFERLNQLTGCDMSDVDLLVNEGFVQKVTIAGVTFYKITESGVDELDSHNGPDEETE